MKCIAVASSPRLETFRRDPHFFLASRPARDGMNFDGTHKRAKRDPSHPMGEASVRRSRPGASRFPERLEADRARGCQERRRLGLRTRTSRGIGHSGSARPVGRPRSRAHDDGRHRAPRRGVRIESDAHDPTLETALRGDRRRSSSASRHTSPRLDCVGSEAPAAKAKAHTSDSHPAVFGRPHPGDPRSILIGRGSSSERRNRSGSLRRCVRRPAGCPRSGA